MRKSTLKKHVRGYSLVEFMVAGIIGLILLFGITTLFINTKKTNNVQSALDEVHANGRFVLHYLTDDIQNAGWQDVGVNENIVGFLDSHIIFDADTFNNTNNNDAIKIAYDGDTDCLGGTVASGQVQNRYYVDDNKQLMCKGNSSATAQPIIGNVESFQLLYGVDTSNDKAPNKFVTSNLVLGLDRLNVVALKIGILLSSSNDALDSAQSRAYSVLNEGAISSNKDKKVRKIFTTTIPLLNKPG